MTELPPVRSLTCSCCGESTKGRQWHNRDIGYGLCKRCAEVIPTNPRFHDRHEYPTVADQMKSYYGLPGIYYNIIEVTQ